MTQTTANANCMTRETSDGIVVLAATLSNGTRTTGQGLEYTRTYNKAAQQVMLNTIMLVLNYCNHGRSLSPMVLKLMRANDGAIMRELAQTAYFSLVWTAGSQTPKIDGEYATMLWQRLERYILDAVMWVE